MKTVRLLTLGILVLSLVLTACQPATPEPTPEPTVAPTEEPTEEPMPTEEPVSRLSCAEPVKVGLITDLTGTLAFYGVVVLPSFMLGMEYATGAPGSAGAVFDVTATQENIFMLEDCEIHIFVRDDAGVIDNTATLARELIDVEGVDILVGTVSSAGTATLQGIAAESMIPLIVAPAAANDITGVNFNEYTFRVSRNGYQDAMNECLYLTKQYKTFVQIAPDYAFGQGAAAGFRDACTLGGGEFVADDIFAPLTTTDFTPYMDPILNSGAEALIVSWAGGGFVPLLQAATDQGVFEKTALASPFIDNVLMPLWYGNAIGSTNGILYHWSAPDNAANDFLVAEVKARYGTMPDLFSADGMNAAIMVVEGIKATNGDPSADALIAAYEGMSFEGPKGTIDIRSEDHVAIQDMYILKLLNLTDPDKNFYEYVETTRPEPPCLLPENLKDRCGDLPYGSLSGE